MDPNQENVRKKLLLRILANYKKKKLRKRRKFVREKENKTKKISLYRKKKTHTNFDFWLIVYYWDQFDTITKKTAFLNLQTHPSVLDLGHFWPSLLNFGQIRSIFVLIYANLRPNFAVIWP